MADEQQKPELQMTTDSLYREELFTDRRIGTIQRLTPITPAGESDPGRPVVYLGQTQILTPAGSLPINFEIPAASLQEAAAGFGAAAEEAIADTMNRLEELRREASSSIIVPGSGVGPLGGAGGPGGIPGGGGIRTP